MPLSMQWIKTLDGYTSPKGPAWSGTSGDDFPRNRMYFLASRGGRSFLIGLNVATGAVEKQFDLGVIGGYFGVRYIPLTDRIYVGVEPKGANGIADSHQMYEVHPDTGESKLVINTKDSVYVRPQWMVEQQGNLVILMGSPFSQNSALFFYRMSDWSLLEVLKLGAFTPGWIGHDATDIYVSTHDNDPFGPSIQAFRVDPIARRIKESFSFPKGTGAGNYQGTLTSGHFWIGNIGYGGAGSETGYVYKLRKDKLSETVRINTGTNSPCFCVVNDGQYVVAGFQNNQFARIHPTTNEVKLFDLPAELNNTIYLVRPNSSQMSFLCNTNPVKAAMCLLSAYQDTAPIPSPNPPTFSFNPQTNTVDIQTFGPANIQVKFGVKS